MGMFDVVGDVEESVAKLLAFEGQVDLERLNAVRNRLDAAWVRAVDATAGPNGATSTTSSRETKEGPPASTTANLNAATTTSSNTKETAGHHDQRARALAHGRTDRELAGL